MTHYPFYFVLMAMIFTLPAAFSHPVHQVAKLGPTPQSEPQVIPFAKVQQHKLGNSTLQGLATRSLGARQHEVWRSVIEPGGKTPFHTHDSEETFVFLSGEGVIKYGDKTVSFKAPCTVIAPGGIPHQVINTGKVATEQIVIVSVGSKIKSVKTGKELKLPWRL